MQVKKALWVVFAIVAVILALVLANAFRDDTYTDPADFEDQQSQNE